MTTELSISHRALEARKQILLKDLKDVVSDADDLLKEVCQSGPGRLCGNFVPCSMCGTAPTPPAFLPMLLSGIDTAYRSGWLDAAALD